MYLSSKHKNKSLLFDLIKIILLIEIGAFFVYKLNFSLSNFLFYSFIFYLFIVSKNIVWWASFLFIMLNSPWGLFYYKPYEWYVSLTPTVGISYISMFGLVFMIKASIYFKSRNFKIPDYFIKFYKPIGFFILFLFIWSFVYGHNTVSIFNMIQFLPAFLLFISVPRLLNEKELQHFNKIIFLFSLVHFLGSIIDIITHGMFIQLISFGKSVTGASYEKNIIRFVGGITIHLYVMIIGLYYLSNKTKHFKKWYLWLVILTSYMFILNSATRGWMIASSFLLIGYYITTVLKGKSSLKTFASFILILIFFYILIPRSIINNLNAAFNRLETVEALAEGDETAGGTLTRLTERGPRVLTRFWESPIVGFGYSKITAEYFDPHVGNYVLLLMGGIVGLAVMWLTVLFLALYFFRKDLLFQGSGLFVFGLAMITIMIIHSSSRTVVSYYMPTDSAFLIALLMNHFNTTFPLKDNY